MSEQFSEDVMALSPEIDEAISAMNVEESTRGDFTDEKAEETPGEVVAEETDTAIEEVENVAEETEGSEEVASEDSVSGDDGGEETERAEVAPPEISSDTLERAVAAGIPVADAKALTPESLERVIQARVDASYQEQVDWQREQDKGTVKEKPKDLFADFQKLDPEKYEPEIIEQMERFKEIARNQQAELQEFRDHNEQTAKSVNSAADREMEQWFDGQVENLGDDFKESLGEGRYRDLGRGSMQFENRAAIVGKMSIMSDGYQAQGLESPSRDYLFDEASRIVLGDTYAEVKDKKLQGSLEKQSRQHIRRAGGGKVKGQLNDEEAIAAEIEKRFG